MDLAIAKIRKQCNIWEHQDALAYLKEIYKLSKSLIKSYTLTHFSRDLGFGENNTMAQIHSGHRKLSMKAGRKIAESLQLMRAESAFFMTLVELYHVKTQQEKEEKLALILELQGRHVGDQQERAELEFFNDWRYAVVFELLELEHPQTIAELAARFSMPIEEDAVERSVALLIKLNLAQEEPAGSGRYIKLTADFSVGGSVPGMAIVRFHQEMMNLAKASLLDTPPHLRDISSVTISLDEKTIHRVKEDIQMFRKYLLFLASQSDGESNVMQVNIQFFPLSK